MALPLLNLAADGQTPKTEQSKGTPIVRVTTRLVEVSVLVHDKKGISVSGLTKDDFELLDNGKPQQIGLFSEKSSHPLTGKSIALPSGTFSNRPAYQGNVTTAATALLIDGLNTDFSTQADARVRVIHFMAQELRSHDRIAIYLLGRDLRVVHDFSGEPSSLMASLIKNQPYPTPEYYASDVQNDVVVPGVALDLAAAALIGGVQAEMGAYYARKRTDMTTDAIIAIANHLRNVPGRKNLVWVSAGFPLFIGDSTSPFSQNFVGKAQKAARALTDADVAIYPVDARGLTIDPEPPQGSVIETMRFLAAQTGGVAFYNSNDVAVGIRQAIDDSAVSYTLGFYPVIEKWDGSFHDIKVRMKSGEKGLNVRFRRGYFAAPDKPNDSKTRDSQITDAISSPLDASGVGITASMEEPKVPTSKIRMIHLNIDASAIHLQETKGRWDGAFDIIFTQRTAAGKVLNPSDQTMKLHLLPATYQQVMSAGYSFTKKIDLAPDAAEIRLIVRDTTTNELGSLTIPLTVLTSKAQ